MGNSTKTPVTRVFRRAFRNRTLKANRRESALHYERKPRAERHPENSVIPSVDINIVECNIRRQKKFLGKRQEDRRNRTGK